MEGVKKEILEKHCYTELVYGRINKKLNLNLSKEKIEELLRKTIEETEVSEFKKKGKNFYVSNHHQNIRVTVNSYTFRIITVDRILKK